MKTVKINLLFVVYQLGAGGTERVVLDLARHIDKSKFNVYAAYFSGGDLLEAMKEVSQQLIHIHKKKGFDPGAMIQLERIIKKNKIDVVNAHAYPPFLYSYFGAKMLHNRSLVITEHAVADLEIGRKKSMHERICKLLFYRTNAVIGVSKGITDSFKNSFPYHSKKMLTVTNGVEVERFDILVDRISVRDQLGILPSHFVIGTIANFRRVKNHVCFIKAFHILSTALPNARLVLVGQGFSGDPESSEYESKCLVKSLGLENRVIFTGYREDIPSILKSFDIFCLPSFSEGLPVSILEAMAAGIPVVGSDVRGINEVISPEDTGLLFPVNDVRSLVHILKRLIENPGLRSMLSKNAFDYVSKAHGIRQWVDKYQRIFQGSIGRH